MLHIFSARKCFLFDFFSMSQSEEEYTTNRRYSRKETTICQCVHFTKTFQQFPTVLGNIVQHHLQGLELHIEFKMVH